MQLTVILNAKLITGPDFLDERHVGNWLESPAGPIENELVVCTRHENPVNCDCDLTRWDGHTALYRLSVDEVVTELTVA